MSSIEVVNQLIRFHNALMRLGLGSLCERDWTYEDLAEAFEKAGAKWIM